MIITKMIIEPHNVIQYMVNYRNHPNLQKYFTIGEMSGELIINLQESKLDRDNGEDIHEIYINFEDNYQGSGVRNGNQTMVRLILLDVNDNAPEMPIKEEYEISENTAEVIKEFFKNCIIFQNYLTFRAHTLTINSTQEITMNQIPSIRKFCIE